ncbi:MAG TPA: NADP-dependent oxidoreductase [Acidimicrobiia bacterium]|nr:NADP-dependent oxidoreductase [Acidimicrobiia bacterium]
MNMMNAVRIHAYGDPGVLTFEQAPRPTAGAGEVLIRVHATSINPFDAAVRAGYMVDYFNHQLPLILGTDAAGVIEEIGPGVDGFSPGDEVFARGGVSRDGSYAEFITVAADDVAKKPRSLDFVHSAAIPHVTLTAWQALYEAAGLAEGQTVLIHGAAGGVGHVAVQLAKLRGATVIGTGSTNVDFLGELGVDQIVDYSTSRFEDEIDEGSVDVVLDTVGDDSQERSWPLLKTGGMLVSAVRPPSEEAASAHGVRQDMVYSVPPIGPTLTEVATLVDTGKIVPEVSRILPLSDVKTGHELIETRHTRGKIAVQITD